MYVTRLSAIAVSLFYVVSGTLLGATPPAPGARMSPSKPNLVNSLRKSEPDIIMVGNSMQGQGIDFRALSKQLGMKVFNAQHGGAMTIWQYGVLQYVLPKIKKTPRMVLVVERMNHFTCPQKRARTYQAKSRELAGDEDWSIVQRLAVNGEGQPSWKRDWDRDMTPLDGFFWDFEKSVKWSLLPHMIQSARRGGYLLVIVRHKARIFAEKPDWYPPEMQKYANDMGYYLQVNNVPFLDYDRQPDLEWDVYANGDHLSVEGKEIWTDLMAADLKALLEGKTAPNQHLPPTAYKPSSELAAIAASTPVLPDPPPAPPEPPAKPVRARTVQRVPTKTRTPKSVKPAAPKQRKSGLTSSLESVIYYGEGMRAQKVIIAVAMLPGPDTSLRWLHNQIKKTEIGAVPLDLSEAFSKVENREELYLSPTKLSPKGVEFVANALADLIKARFSYVAVPLQVYDSKPVTIQVNPNRKLTINQVRLDRSEKFIQQTHQTRLVLVGNSNVGLYSDPVLGMGEHAGLGEHLSKALGRPLQWRWRDKHPKDAIVEMMKEIDLAQTAVVVWVFMADDLKGPRWGHIPVIKLKQFDQPDHLVVKARITKKSPPPSPDVEERYPDTVNYTLWEVQEIIKGEYQGKELLTVEWSQKDLDFLWPFQYEEGQEFILDLVPLTAAAKNDRAIRKGDFVDAVRRNDLPPFWIMGHNQQ